MEDIVVDALHIRLVIIVSTWMSEPCQCYTLWLVFYLCIVLNTPNCRLYGYIIIFGEYLRRWLNLTQNVFLYYFFFLNFVS